MPPQIKQNNLSVKSRYRPEIDGLRAFAVIAVIINHFNKEILPNGYLGVDIFFVISGFVITSSLYQRPSENFKDFISGFYERRIKRLVPALSVFVLIMSIAICLFNLKPIVSLRTGLTSLFGLSNLYLLKQSTDYFAQSTELNVFTHTWSLGVEEQFYILFPFLIWFSGFGRQTKNSARNLFLIVGALTIASLIGFIYLYTINQSAAYFLMPTRFWEMASGCLLFIGLEKRKSIEQFLEKVPPILVLGLIVGIMYLPMSLATTSTVMVVVLSLVIIASLKKGTASYIFFTDSRVVYIGLISYSLYLWHWGVLSISRWTIGVHWWSIPFQIAFMFGLAITSYRYIETPLRKGKWFGNRSTLLIGGGVITMISAICFNLTKYSQLFYLGSGKTVSNQYKCRSDLQEFIRETDNIRCFSFEDKKQNLNQSIWIMGDSIPGWGNGNMIGQKISKQLRTNVHIISNGSNPYPPQIYTHDTRPMKIAKSGVQTWDNLITKLLPLISKEDTVILLNRTLNRFSDWENIVFSDGFNNNRNMRYHNYKGIHLPSKALDFHLRKLDNFASLLKTKHISFIVIGPFHDLMKTNGTCLQKEWFNSPQCSTKIDSNVLSEDASSYAKKFNEKYIKEVKLRKIKIIDLFKDLCPGVRCGSKVEGKDIFYDYAHFSEEGSRIIASQIIKHLLSAKRYNKISN